MSLVNENHEDLNGAYVNNEQDYTGKEQTYTDQPCYLKPDENNNGDTQFNQESTPLEASSNLHTISHNQVPDFFRELEIMSQVSNENIMDSLICKIQPVTQNSVSSSMSYQDSELHRKVESLFEAMSFSMDNLTYEVQTFEQDRLSPPLSGEVWDYYPVIEFSPETNNNCVTNSLDCMENVTSVDQIHLSLQNLLPSPSPDLEFHLSLLSIPETYLNCENQSSVQDSLTPFESPKNATKDSLGEIFKTEKPKKPKKTSCQCPNCNAVGGNQTRDSNGQLQHVCHIPHCMKVFNRTSGLKRHLAVHKSYSCAHCPKEFELKREIRTHVKKHIPGNWQHICPIVGCGKIYEHPGSLYRHLASHKDENNFICPYCYRKFSRNYTLKAHIQVHMTSEKRLKCQCPNCSVEGGNKIKDSKGRLLHNCHIPNCGKVFTRPWYLKKHLETNCGKRKLVCAQCNEGFQRRDYLELHLKTHMPAKHPKKCRCLKCSAGNANKSDPICQHMCQFSNCKKVFTRAWDLKRHLVLHSREKSFICAHCDNEFTCKRGIICHIKKHMTDKQRGLKNDNINSHVSQSLIPENEISLNSKVTKCQCPNCRAEGGNKARDSKGKLLHACHIPNCERVFSRTSHLEEHLRRHRGEKDFFCDHCNKGFMRKNGLISHLKVHMAGYEQNKRQISNAVRNVRPIRQKPSTEYNTMPIIDIMSEQNVDLLCALEQGFLVYECSEP